MRSSKMPSRRSTAAKSTATSSSPGERKNFSTSFATPPVPLLLSARTGSSFTNCADLISSSSSASANGLTGSRMLTADTVGRVGGEEFIVVAPETTLEGAIVLGERIRSAVDGFAFSYKGHPIRVTVSVGFAVVSEDVVAEYDQLKHIAAAALAEAK